MGIGVDPVVEIGRFSIAEDASFKLYALNLQLNRSVTVGSGGAGKANFGEIGYRTTLTADNLCHVSGVFDATLFEEISIQTIRITLLISELRLGNSFMEDLTMSSVINGEIVFDVAVAPQIFRARFIQYDEAGQPAGENEVSWNLATNAPAL